MALEAAQQQQEEGALPHARATSLWKVPHHLPATAPSSSSELPLDCLGCILSHTRSGMDAHNLLVSCKASLNLKNDQSIITAWVERQPPAVQLLHAARLGRAEVVQQLLDEQQAACAGTAAEVALRAACLRGHTDIVRALLCFGHLNPNAASLHMNALHIASLHVSHLCSFPKHFISGLVMDGHSGHGLL